MWACTYFQDYITGMWFHVETDHKPLISILFNKSLNEFSLSATLPPSPDVIQLLHLTHGREESDISQ